MTMFGFGQKVDQGRESELGCKMRDRITRFEGVVTGKVHYISGCSQLLLSPGVDKDGKLQSAEWFDEQRCELVPGEIIYLDNTKTPGPDREAPKR